MTISLIDGSFPAQDALQIITQIIHVKIKYHESKITHDGREEDVKYRETKIKRLQKDLYDIRKYIEGLDGKVSMQSSIKLNNE